jgi:preprotein translocase subunit SecA
MRIFGSEKLQSMLSKLGLKDDEAITHRWITKTLEKAQQKVENRNYEIRKNLLKYDDVINQQRKIIFKQRTDLINSRDITDKIHKISQELNEEIALANIPKNSYPEQWDIKNIESEIKRIYDLNLDVKKISKMEGAGEDEIVNFINKETANLFKERVKKYSQEIEEKLQKQIFLMTLDGEWKDHLHHLDKLRYSINLRAYGQKDPLIEYKREAFNLFEDMMLKIEELTINRISHALIEINDEEKAKIDLLSKIEQKGQIQTREDPALSAFDYKKNLSDNNENHKPLINNVNPEKRDPKNPLSWGNIGRNEFCPCGSGKKYKKCHG